MNLCSLDISLFILVMKVGLSSTSVEVKECKEGVDCIKQLGDVNYGTTIRVYTCNPEVEHTLLNEDEEDPVMFQFYQKELNELNEYLSDKIDLYVDHGTRKDLEKMNLQNHTADSIHSLYIHFEIKDIEDVDSLKKADGNIRYTETSGTIRVNYSSFHWNIHG
jgi:hypothetical protein